MKIQNSGGRSQEARRKEPVSQKKRSHKSGARHQDSRSLESGRLERESRSHEPRATR
jgi:hypothetical protein